VCDSSTHHPEGKIRNPLGQVCSHTSCLCVKYAAKQCLDCGVKHGENEKFVKWCEDCKVSKPDKARTVISEEAYWRNATAGLGNPGNIMPLICIHCDAPFCANFST
jgi:hypothetical protein